MKLIFFDEAKQDDTHPHYHIGGVCIDESDLFDVEAQVNATVERCFGRTDLDRTTEIHAAVLYHRKKNFRRWRDFGERISILNDFMQILTRPEVQLIHIQINTDRLYAAQDPADIAFMYLCERANGLARREQALGILIGDRESDGVAERFAKTLAGYREDGTPWEFGRDIRNLVDSVHFTHSHLSRFLQLADVYTWLLQFCVRNQGSEDPHHRSLFELMAAEGINWFPSTHKEWPK